MKAISSLVFNLVSDRTHWPEVSIAFMCLLSHTSTPSAREFHKVDLTRYSFCMPCPICDGTLEIYDVTARCHVLCPHCERGADSHSHNLQSLDTSHETTLNHEHLKKEKPSSVTFYENKEGEQRAGLLSLWCSECLQRVLLFFGKPIGSLICSKNKQEVFISRVRA